MSRRVSFDDSVRPSSRPSRLVRSKSDDHLTRKRRRDVDYSSTIMRNRSEGDWLSVTVRRILEEKRERERDRIDEICRSRSLFDSVAIPLPSRSFKFQIIRIIRIITRFFIPLQLGIIAGLLWANLDYQSYESSVSGHSVFHFIINDIFMTFFFGIAMVHVTTALLPGGALSPFRRAVGPILGTIGGVCGPAAVYLTLVAIEGVFDTQSQGWAVCIATDISIAWLLATQVFGSGEHPAVRFLLLLAVVDDVIGLVVIAIAFPSPDMNLIWLLLLLASFALSASLRFLFKISHWAPYILLSGPVAWASLYLAGVHPALALCFVVPFIPGHDNLEKFDHDLSLFVHIGLFGFALSNAGVVLSDIGLVTMNITLSLVIGKTLGIFLLAAIGSRWFPLPDGMNFNHLGLVSHLSGVGLTVALFVSELAFSDPTLAGQAKIGALLSAAVAPGCILIGRLTGAHKPLESKNRISGEPTREQPLDELV